MEAESTSSPVPACCAVQVHISLLSELGTPFVDFVTTHSLGAWSNSLEYAWRQRSKAASKAAHSHLAQASAAWQRAEAACAAAAHDVGLGRPWAGSSTVGAVEVVKEGQGNNVEQPLGGALEETGVLVPPLSYSGSDAARSWGHKGEHQPGARFLKHHNVSSADKAYPPVPSVMLQQEVLEALQQPVLPAWGGAGTAGGAVGTLDQHKPMAADASSVAVDLEGFVLVVDVAVGQGATGNMAGGDTAYVAVMCDGEERFCVCVDGRGACMQAGAGAVLGGEAQWQQGVLRRLGWRVKRLPFWEWPGRSVGRVQWLGPRSREGLHMARTLCLDSLLADVRRGK